MDKKVSFWDGIAEKYDSKSMAVYKDAYEATISLSRKYIEGSKNVFEYACGTGITTVEFARWAEHLTAIDISGRMIEQAENKAKEKGIDNIDFRTVNIENGSFEDASFNVVTAFNVIYFLDNPAEVLKRLNAMLVPGGIFLSATDCDGEGKKIKVAVQKILIRLGILPLFRLMKISELEELIQAAGFEILEQKNLFDNPPNMFIAARKID